MTSWHLYFRIALSLLLTCSGAALPGSTGAQCPDFLAQWGTHGGAPDFLATDASGNVFVADTYNHRVLKFTGAGEYLTQWGVYGSAPGQFDAPEGIATDASGSVYVADTNNGRIQKFTGTGVFLSQWNSYGSSGPLTWPMGVATDADGNVYVTDAFTNYIGKFTGTGEFILRWKYLFFDPRGHPADPLNQPWGIATDMAGNVYVADTMNARVVKFTNTGTYLTRWGGGERMFNFVMGLATDSAGNVYACDPTYPCVQKFTSAGAFICLWGVPGSDPGQFGPSSPRGIAVGPDGIIFAVDSGNDRILTFGYGPTPAANATWGQVKNRYRN